MTFDRRVVLLFILLFGFFARAATYKAPLFDHHGWRQADTASIARNFYRERFNIFYPQVDQRGARDDGYVETGLELFAFLVATVSLVAGFHVQTGRVLSALFFVGSCLLAYTFVRRRYGDRHGLIAAFLYAFGFPLLLYIERAFMNEALLILLSLACLTSTQRYLERPGPTDLGVLLVCSSLIAMIKLPYLIIWFPVAGLFIERHGPMTVRRWELWGIGALNLAAAAAWYTHARALGETTGLSFGLADKLFDPAIVFSPAFPAWVLDRMFIDILEPVGFIGVTAGLWLACRTRRWCEVLAVVGFAAYLVIVAGGNFHHDYYQLAIVPIAPGLAAAGLIWLCDALSKGATRRRDGLLVVALALGATSTFVRSVSAHSWYEYGAEHVETCRLIRDVIAPDERVVFVGEENPQMLFCLDRRGWLLAPDDASEQRVAAIWRAGARIAVVPAVLERPDTRRFLSERGRLLMERQSVEVYRLP